MLVVGCRRHGRSPILVVGCVRHKSQVWAVAWQLGHDQSGRCQQGCKANREKRGCVAPLKLLLLYGQLELQILLLSDVVLLDQHRWATVYGVLQQGCMDYTAGL